MTNDKTRRAVMVQNREMDGGKPPGILVYATFPGLEGAMSAGRKLVEVGHAACINVLPGMTSIYRWEGQIETASEAVLIAKTTPEFQEACMRAILEAHPYDTPAVVAIALTGGSAAYLEWIAKNTGEA